jgi:hypothetical protein
MYPVMACDLCCSELAANVFAIVIEQHTRSYESGRHRGTSLNPVFGPSRQTMKLGRKNLTGADGVTIEY